MLSATDGWASGENASSHGPALILQYDGHSWQTQSTPTFSQVSYTSDLQVQRDGEVWADVQLFSESTGQFATTDASAILHYDGHLWRVQESLPNVNLYSLSMGSLQEGWVLGNIANTTTGSAPLFLWHYAHGTLTRLPVQQVTQHLSTIPAGSFIILSSVSMVSPTDVWAIGSWVLGSDHGFFALHYDGEHWLPTSLPEVAGPSGFILLVISYQPDGKEWIIGSISKSITLQGQQPFVAWAPLILNYEGETWTVALE
jgi:hypothetical protein